MTITKAIVVTLFWALAAFLVMTTHTALDARSPSGAAVVTIAALLATAYAYTKLCAPHAGVGHALGVGIAWLLLAIVAEIAMTSHLRHGWYAIIGSPDRPLLRNLLLFVWIFAPALFAHQEGGSQQE